MRIISAWVFLAVATPFGLGALFAPEQASAGLEEGVKAYDAGDYATAIREWNVEAGKGNRNALFNLGQVHRMGRGVPKNIDLAEHYYLEAAKLGHPAAQGNLGTLYYFGKVDGKPQFEKALKWWKLAGRNGDPRSQYMMGVLYFNGKFVERDMVQAYAWMWLASKAHLKEAVQAEEKMMGFMAPDERAAGKKLAETLTRGQGSEPVDMASASVMKITPPQAVAEKPVSRVPVSRPIEPTPPPAKLTPPPARPTPPPAKPALPPAPLPVLSASQPLPPASTAVPAATVADGAAFRLQLGAYKSRDITASSWADLQRAQPALLGGLNLVIMEADLGVKGLFYRLQAGSFASRREAELLCNKLKARRQACLVVKATL